MRPIGNALSLDIRLLVSECNEHMAYANKNYLPFLLKPFQSVRPLLFNCLEITTPRSTSSDRTLERLIEALTQIRGNGVEMTELRRLGIDAEKDFDWMTARWRKLVCGKSTGGPVQWINRKYFELAVLFSAMDELKSGDLSEGWQIAKRLLTTCLNNCCVRSFETGTGARRAPRLTKRSLDDQASFHRRVQGANI